MLTAGLALQHACFGIGAPHTVAGRVGSFTLCFEGTRSA